MLSIFSRFKEELYKRYLVAVETDLATMGLLRFETYLSVEQSNDDIVSVDRGEKHRFHQKVFLNLSDDDRLRVSEMRLKLCECK